MVVGRGEKRRRLTSTTTRDPFTKMSIVTPLSPSKFLWWIPVCRSFSISVLNLDPDRLRFHTVENLQY